MRPLARALFAVISGFLIGEAQTAHPWLALVCLAPWMVAQMAPTVDAQGRAGAPLGPWGSAGLGALAYATASTYGWGIGQYGVTIFLAGMVYLSLGGALFGLLMWPLGRAPSRYVRVLGFTGAWVLVEYARTLGSASYPILVGAGLGEYPVLAQLGSVGGAWLLGAFVAALSALLAEAFEAALLREHPTLPPGRAADWLALALALLATVALGGAARLALAGPPGAVLWSPEAAPPPAPYVTVASLQGGVPTWLYRRATAMPHIQETIDANYFDLLDKSLEARPWGAAPRWFVLPEASLNRELPRGPAAVGAVPGLRERRLPAGTTLLLGTTTGLKEADPAYPAATRENVVMALRPDAEGRLVYQDSVGKRRLVPISEVQYRPQERWRPLEVPEARLGVMICYESLYPDITAAMPEAELWLVAANDAGLRWSQAPRIHARLGILRAIETGRGLIHASQAGYSFLVDPYGRRTGELGLFERGVILGGVTTAHVPTLYQVLGRAWVLLAASIWAFSLFLSRRMTAKSDR